MAETQRTHINAYLTELDEAEKAALQAEARVSELKTQINQHLAEDGEDPMFNNDGKRVKRKKREPIPAGADGFGNRTAGQPKVDEEGNA